MAKYPITNTIVADAGRRATESEFPFKDMKEAKIKDGKIFGDSFLIKDVTVPQISAKVYKAAKKENIAVALRTFPDGVRVYKVKKQDV